MTGDHVGLLKVDGLSKTYGGSRRGSAQGNHVLKSVSFELALGESIGIVGESGSGKTTLGNCIAGLVKPTAGTITLDGLPLSSPRRRRRPALDMRVQMVFQNSAGSLNPAKPVGHSLGLPLRCAGRRDVERAVGDLLEQVGLHRSDGGRLPAEFSGGQRQRINIARALALRPDVIICDEPTSGLDVSVQAHICALLQDLAEDIGTSFIFITHDLAVVQLMANRILVMNQGAVVDDVLAHDFVRSENAYTRALLDAIPGNDV